MADVHTPETRSRNMAAIRGKNTRPEVMVRRWLHAEGFRFRLNNRRLPGSPDIVLAKYKAVIFVHGCFWHLHDCPLFHWPASRPEWWREKLTANQQRDLRNQKALAQLGWRVAVVWECSLRGRLRPAEGVVAAQLSEWLHSDRPCLEISGSG